MTFSLKLIIAIILLLALLQYLLTKIDDFLYPPPGIMVDLGGYKLHVKIEGNPNGPTVILDMGLGGNLLYWSLVQSKIAKFAQVISYDRAGIGWSDRGNLPKTSENIVDELHKLLDKANIKGPYILVGHSFAGITSRIFANKYPQEVAGVILVDSSHEHQMKDLPRATDFLSRILYNKTLHPFIWASAQIGIVRAYNFYNYKEKFFDRKTHKNLHAKESSSKFISSLLEEWRLFEENLEEIKEKKYDLGNMPLIVITASMTPTEESCIKHGHMTMKTCLLAHKIWHALQKDLATKSTNSKQILAYNSGHIIQRDEPDIIVEAVKEMVKELKNVRN